MRSLRPLVLASALLHGWASVASSGTPSGIFSTLDPCMVFCPAGDLTFHVVVRDGGGNLVPNSRVWLDFSRCPMFATCPDVPPPLVADRTARTITLIADASGVANFTIPMGGICPGQVVEVIADNVDLGNRSLASPDRDGSLTVDAADQAAVQALVGTNDYTADLNCDGVVTTADVAIVGQHLSHACAGATPARRRSWGELKLIYR